MTKIKPWVELSRETIFHKYGREMTKVIFRLPNGLESDFYLRDHDTQLVCVLALTSDNQVILAKQYRPGPQKILSELPGGVVNKDEIPLEAIKREFLEECGYTGNFKQITKSVTGAYSEAVRYHFIATNCHKVQEIKNDDTEFTEVELMSLSKFRQHLRSGQLTDIATGYFGLDYLHLL